MPVYTDGIQDGYLFFDLKYGAKPTNHDCGLAATDLFSEFAEITWDLSKAEKVND